MNNTKITLVFSYYKNPKMLRYQMNFWKEYPSSVEIALVDDGSPQGMRAEEVIEKYSPPSCPFQLFRILVDVPWNVGGAKNVAAFHARSQWIFLLEIDHIMMPDTIKELLEYPFEKECIYRFPRIKHHTRKEMHAATTVVLMNTEKFLNFGGFDEAYSGHYGFPERFFEQDLNEFNPVTLPYPLDLVYPGEIDDARTSGLTRKEGRDEQAIHDISEWKQNTNTKSQMMKFPWMKII